MKTVRFVIQIVLGIVLPLAVQRWDRGRLSPAQRAAAWNGATWGAALYAFGPLSMLGWCWVTRGAWHGPPLGWARRARRGLVALLLGLLAVAGIFVVIVGVDQLVALALGLEP